MKSLPLLLQGFAVLEAATLVNDSIRYTITQNRGNVIMMDLISAFKIGDLRESQITVSVGGIEIIQATSLENFNAEAFQGRYRAICADYRGGQTINVQLNNQSAVTAQVYLHLGYENPWNEPQWIELLNQCASSLHISENVVDVATGLKGAGKFTLPKNRGQIVAIQPVAYGANTVGMQGGIMSVSSNGVTIFEDIQLSYGSIESSRNNIFPIHLENAGTLEIDIENNGTNDVTAGVKLYYAPDELAKPLVNGMGC